jgi:L-ribulose-5-phosphate 3-epimerase
MQRFKIGAITDEFSPDIQVASESMASLGMEASELRMVFGRNIIDLTDDEIDRALAIVRAHSLPVISIASPLLKCTLPDAPATDSRFQQDAFASQHSFADQPRLTRRAFEIAHRTGARIIRVFTYWRTIDPPAVFDRVVEALGNLSDQAAKEDLIIGLENEHACNIATAAETRKVLDALDHPALKVVWDPGNAYVSGEIPFPGGYSLLPVNRIAHVHAKDCKMDGNKPIWGALGECDIDWKGQIDRLARDGYSGYINLETHWPGPGGDKLLASMICGRNLRQLVEG